MPVRAVTSDIGVRGLPAAPRPRCRDSALKALTTFAWTISALYRVELHIEPWNNSSIHVAEAAGYQREGLLRSYLEIGGTGRTMLLYATTRP
jgi:RimJ/RimL family protein N-acetyltransferase